MEVDQGHLHQAALYAQESLALARRFGTAPLITLALNSMASIVCQQKDYVQAKQYLIECIAIARGMGDGLMITRVHLKLAEIALIEDDLHTINVFVNEKSYQQYRTPEMVAMLEACKRYIEAQK
jgi:hypothetical protein